MSQNTKLLTGIPRSGTTLCCYLLNEAADTVALHEPISPKLFYTGKPPVEVIGEAIDRFRATLLEEGRAVSKQVDGKIPANSVHVDGSQDRRESVILGEFTAGQSLSADFTLVVKHNALFAALLPQLERKYPVSCVVRNPLPVLASWQSVNLPVGSGSVPMAERYDEVLRARLAELENVLEKQLAILGWFFGQFRNQPGIIRYEEVIRTNGEILSVVAGKPFKASPSLTFQNRNSGLADEELRVLTDHLLSHPEVYEGFYRPAEIEQQLLEMLD